MKKGVSDKTPHRWHRPKVAPWLQYCWRCGLVALKNERTEKAIKAGCFTQDEAVLDITGP